MILTALTLDLAFLLVAVVARSAMQLRRTGDLGWRFGRAHSVSEAVARALVVGSVVCAVGGLVAGTATTVPAVLGVAAVVVAVAGIALVVVAQLQMGASWRIGVAHDEETALVRDGLFAAVRNPIYTGMVLFMAAHAVLVPSTWTVVGALVMVAGVQLQVRHVEEPYLRSMHGEQFAAWAATSGRFLPGVG